MIAGVAGPTSTVVAPGADTVSIAQVAAVECLCRHASDSPGQWSVLCNPVHHQPERRQRHLRFQRGHQRGHAAAAPSVGSGGIIDSIAGLLGGPSGSLNGNPFSLSSNSANIGNIGAGNWASAMSDCLGMAGGGLLPAGSRTPSVTPPVPQHSPARRRLSAAWLARLRHDANGWHLPGHHGRQPVGPAQLGRSVTPVALPPHRFRPSALPALRR